MRIVKDDIIKLKEDAVFYPKGLLCKVLNAQPFDNARVEIVGGTFNDNIGKVKYADLSIFELVRREQVGFYI